MSCPMRNAHCPRNAPEGRDSVEDSIVRQLQRSMERNARMVNRLRRLRAECSGPNEFEPRRGIVDDLDCILKDEEPAW